MAEYLTKEEIKQWRSSLEKITLEEYAARLGKLIEEAKPTNDLVDMVMNENSGHTTIEHSGNKQDKFSAIAQRAFERERQISHTPFSVSKPKQQQAKNSVKSTEAKKPSVAPVNNNQQDEINIVLKKTLTDREQMVLDYLLEHPGETIYAKDLAALLSLPRDYVYKYIKNLRAKIEGEKIQNCPGGGFILTA